MELTSQKVNIEASENVVFDMLINCNNIAKYIPHDKIQDFQSTETTCSFTVAGAGKIGMSLQEKMPYSQVSYSLGSAMVNAVTAIFHIERQENNSCQLHISANMDLPFFMVQMIKPSLQRFVNMLVNYIKIEAEKNKPTLYN